MTLKVWYDAAVTDARQRGLPALVPLLDGLARATAALRAADWNRRADEPRDTPGKTSDGR